MKSSKEDVDKFLSDVRWAIENNHYVPHDVKEYRRDISELGLTPIEAKIELCELTFKDYKEGPEENENYHFDDYLWMFKKVINGILVYIKLQIKYKGDKRLVIWSFHIDR